MRIHDYFKYLKFGFDRTNDWCSVHIRRGRISRNQGFELVKKHGGKFPVKYLDVPIEEVLDEIGMTVEEFQKVCDRFTNKKLFKTDARGKLIKDAAGNLVSKFAVG